MLEKQCSIGGCHGRIKARGLCNSHYLRWLRTGSTDKRRVRNFCSVDGCDGPARGHGFCNAHYLKWKKHGDPLGGRQTPDGAPLEFLRTVAIPFDGDECLLWPFGRSGNGYGTLHVAGKKCLAHRLVCEAANGTAPAPRLEAAHNCGGGHNGCVNPRHLRWATHQQNMNDRGRHGTALAKLTEDDVRAIRQMPNKPLHEIAAAYGVDRTTIHAVRSRKTWTWVE